MDLTFLDIDNRLAVALIAAIIGALLSLVVQRILNKRGIFTASEILRVGTESDLQL